MILCWLFICVVRGSAGPYHVQKPLLPPVLTPPGLYLPGLGHLSGGGGLADLRRTARSQQVSGSAPSPSNGLVNNAPAAHTKTPANPFIFGGESQKKCRYVQMKGGPLPGGTCHKGGMACEKQCGYGGEGTAADADVDCRVVTEEVCGDVSAPKCATVMESVCDPIKETVCDEDMQLQPETR